MATSLSQRTSRRALESAWLSTTTAIETLRQSEDSPRTRRVSADMLRAFVNAYYPDAPDLMDRALSACRALGGSDLRPKGGRAFRLVLRLFGWRLALRLRRRR